MLGVDFASDKGDEGTLQVIVKYWAICREIGITPLSAEEMAALRKDTIVTFGLASQALLRQDIWQKKDSAKSTLEGVKK